MDQADLVAQVDLRDLPDQAQLVSRHRSRHLYCHLPLVVMAQMNQQDRWLQMRLCTIICAQEAP